jgi:hypothetical protein
MPSCKEEAYECKGEYRIFSMFDAKLAESSRGSLIAVMFDITQVTATGKLSK